MTPKQIVRSFFYRLGFEILKCRLPLTEGHEHIRSHYSTYAPWTQDAAFLNVYKTIYPYTMVDKYRCYELWQLVAQTGKLDGDILEVGVWKGGTGGLLCKRLKTLNIQKTVYLADTFTGVPKVSFRDSNYNGGEHSNTSAETVIDLLSNKLSVDNYVILSGIFPDETGHLLVSERFSFCHVDVDVYDSAKGILEWIWPKLVVGGIMVYDDYGFVGTNGITQFVNEQYDKPDRLVMHNLNGQAVVVKICGGIDEA